MKTKTLFYCPRDHDVLLFEEVYDERLDFVYQPLQELPKICSGCGRVLNKKGLHHRGRTYPERKSILLGRGLTPGGSR